MIKWNDVAHYIKGGDQDTVKFLKAVRHEDELGPVLAALANSEGGHIFVGLDVKNYHLIGTDLDRKWVQNIIDQYCRPSFEAEFDLVSKGEKVILHVFVPSDVRKPVFYKQKCYVMQRNQPWLALVENENFQLEPDLLVDGIESVSGNFPQPPSFPSVSVQSEEERTSDSPVLPNSTEQGRTFDTVLDRSTDHSMDNPGDGSLAASSETQLNEEAEESVASSRLSELSHEEASRTQRDREVILTRPEESESHLAISTPSLLDMFESTKASDNDVDEGQNFSDAPPDAPDAETYSASDSTESSSPKMIVLNVRQKKVLDYLKTHEAIQNKTYREQFRVSHKTAHLELVDMVTKGLLRNVGMGRNTRYVAV